MDYTEIGGTRGTGGMGHAAWGGGWGTGSFVNFLSCGPDSSSHNITFNIKSIIIPYCKQLIIKIYLHDYLHKCIS